MKKSALLLPAALLALAGWAASFSGCKTQPPVNVFTPHIPKTWDDAAMASVEVPLADARHSPVHVTAEYYYRIPAKPIYKSYPIYDPGKEPPGYMEWLAQQEPVILWDESDHRPSLKTEPDWIKAGEMVFTEQFGNLNGTIIASDVRNPAWWRHVETPLARDGGAVISRFVIQKRGRIDVGNFACAACHTRVMPDGTVVKGAQGNSSISRASGWRERHREGRTIEEARNFQRMSFGAPWVRPDPLAGVAQMSAEDFASASDMAPPGVTRRPGTGLFSPAGVPDLIGIKERRYLDRTGLLAHRGIADLMRYSAINQGMDLLARYGDFIPRGIESRELPATEKQGRYSDEQLYALALYIYSLKPPLNPNLPKTAEQRALVERGREAFDREDCARCHKPPLYTNNKLTPARGFKVPDNHPEGTNIMSRSVGSDPTLATMTRRGTGFYKVPSLRGVWYRGPFEHNGSCATLEDWFNPARTNDTYVPTGWRGPPGTMTRAVKGHEFGLDLSADERKALIAFLRTL